MNAARIKLLTVALAIVLGVVLVVKILDTSEPATYAELSGSSTLSFGESRFWLEDLPEDQKVEQIRDWAQIGLASMIGLSGEEAVGFFYDKPGIRAPILSDIGDYPNGPGRTVPAGDILHILVPGEDSFPVRTTALMMDQYLVDTGDDLPQVQIHRYMIDVENGSVEIQHEALKQTSQVRQENGYQETDLEVPSDFEAFLSSTHHLTMVWQEGEGLRASGWSWPESPITSHETAKLAPADIAILQEGHRAVYEASESEPVEPPGFSLDPASDVVGDIEILKSLLPSFSEADIATLDFLRSVQDLEGDVWSEKVNGWLDENPGTEKIVDVLYNSDVTNEEEALGVDATQLWAIGSFLDGDSVAAYARYDGGLAGTEVGMTLFYTDLVAKDWSAGVGSGVPKENGIADFVTASSLGTNWTHCPADSESGRLWFGINTAAASATDEEIIFGPIATQLFARSDSEEDTSEEVTQEVERSYHFGAALRWWDDHYAAVADYEPQFHRLDQIMRWSTALAWLAERETTPLAVDAPVEEDQTLRYQGWIQANQNIREKSTPRFVEIADQANEIVAPIPSASFERCGEEFIQGGVTLGSRFSLKGLDRSAARAVPKPYRRSNMTSESRGWIRRNNREIGQGRFDDFGNKVSPVNRKISYKNNKASVEVRSFNRDVVNHGRNKAVHPGKERNYSFEVSTSKSQITLKSGVENSAFVEAVVTPNGRGASIFIKPKAQYRVQRAARNLQDKLLTGKKSNKELRADTLNGPDVKQRHIDGERTLLEYRDGQWIEFGPPAEGNKGLTVLAKSPDGSQSVQIKPIKKPSNAIDVSSEGLPKQPLKLNNGVIKVESASTMPWQQVSGVAGGKPTYVRVAGPDVLTPKAFQPQSPVSARVATIPEQSTPHFIRVEGATYALVGAAPASATAVVLVDSCDDEECEG